MSKLMSFPAKKVSEFNFSNHNLTQPATQPRSNYFGGGGGANCDIRDRMVRVLKHILEGVSIFCI